MTDLSDNGFEEGAEDSGPMADATFQQSFSSDNGGMERKREQQQHDSRNRSRSRSPGPSRNHNRRQDRGDRRDRDRRGERGGHNRSQYATIIDQRTGRERRVNYEYCVFVSNIPYEVTWSEIKQLMSESVAPVAYVECFNEADGKPAGCAFVEFKEKEAAQKCVEVMNKREFRGRNLVVKEDLDGYHSNKFRRKREQEARAQKLLTPHLLQQLDLDPECLSDTVFAANLSYKMDWRDVKDVFKVAGKVERVDIFKDKDDRSKGLAVVKYESVVDAVNSICMLNGQMLYNRKLAVRMDRERSSNARDRDPPKPKPVPVPRGLDSMGPSLEQLAQNVNSQPGGMGGGGMRGGMGGGGSLGGLGGGAGGGMGGSGGLGGLHGIGGGMGGGLGGGGLGGGGLGGGIGGGLGGGLVGLGSGMNSGLGGPGSSSLGMGIGGGSGLGLGVGSGIDGGLGLGGGIGQGLGGLNPGLGSMGGVGGSLGGLGGGGSLSRGLGSSSNIGSLGLGSGDLSHSLGSSGGMDRLQNDLSPRFSSMREDLPPSRGSGSFGRSDNFPQDVGFRDMDRGMGRDRRDRGSGGSHSHSGGPGGDRDRDLRSSGGGNLAGTPKEGGCQIFIRNLPFSVDWHQLKDACKDIGRVLYADVKTDDQQRSKGYGTVRFERAEEAYRAISMLNGRNFKGRTLDVSLDRY